MAERYPFYDPGIFARGAIQSEADRKMCIERIQNDEKKIGLFECEQNIANQDFELSWHRHIKLNNNDYSCITDGKLEFSSCLFEFGSQLWYYDLVSVDSNYIGFV